MRSEDELIELAIDALRHAKEAGAHDAEAYVMANETTLVQAVGEYATPKHAEEGGLAMRVIVDGRVGQSGSAGTDAATMRKVARAAVAAARVAAPGSPAPTLPAPAASLGPASPVHPRLWETDVDRVCAEVAAAARALREAPLVTYHGVTLTSHRLAFAIANTRGVSAWDRSASERILLEARATRGTTERTAQEMAYAATPLGETVDVARVARGVAERAASALEPRALPSAVDEVIMLPAPVAQLLHVWTPALSARRSNARQSPLAGRVGEQVLHGSISIADEPHGPHGLRRRRVDDEGTPTRNRPLVTRGVLDTLLYDHEAATRAGVESTGHAARPTLGGGVLIGAHCLNVSPGERMLEEVIAGTERAVLVNEPLMGGFVANNVTGDFSLVAPFAFLVENGRIAHALPPTTVGGNVHRSLRDVRDVSRDRQTFALGTYPSLRLGGVSCAT